MITTHLGLKSAQSFEGVLAREESDLEGCRATDTKGDAGLERLFIFHH